MPDTYRHAAIMFTDIVGYLMGSDEQKAVDMLSSNRSIHQSCIEKFNGTLIKEIGDGILASFSLASEAVRCAMDIQKEAKSQHIPLKIGIHQGEILMLESDVLGDGVNLASRLQESAEKGCITISASIYQDIKNKTDIKTQFLAEKTFKNVDEPLKIYNVISEDFEKKDKTEMSNTSNGLSSIAVLPFVNMSNDPDQEYFCDGITEEIINALCHVESLKVIARTSAFMFKGKHTDMREIGKMLEVVTLLEGSVRKAGNRIRITAQLIKVSDGSHLWSERYDRDLDDIFEIQDEISLAIVENLKVRLLGKEKVAIEKRHTENLEAYNLYLKGIYCTSLLTVEGYQEASEYFEQALKLDPDYALPYFGLAQITFHGWVFGSIPTIEGSATIKPYLEKALSIDNTVAESHALMGTIDLFCNWNWEAAEKEFINALQLNPNSADCHYYYSIYLIMAKRHEEAIRVAENMVKLDPLSSIFNMWHGGILLYAHQYEKAIEVLKKAVKMNPGDIIGLYHLGHAYEARSMIRKAIKEYEKILQLSNWPLIVSNLATSYYLIGEKEKAEKLYNSLEQRSNKEYIPPTTLYSYHLVKGDMDQAYKWLEKAITVRDYFLIWYTVCPTIGHTIPDEPRFKALIKPVVSGRDG
jgi:TolB-like protein/Tfp pilus assembly protein PilF